MIYKLVANANSSKEASICNFKCIVHCIWCDVTY